MTRIVAVITFLLLPLTDVVAQDRPEDILVSLRFVDARLKTILDSISSESGVAFSYNTRKINTDQEVSYSAENIALKDVMAELGVTTGYDFSFVENHIVIKPGKKSHTLSGYVSDSENGEVLIGATVFIEELKTGTITNPYGFYSITLPSNAYTVVLSYIGFESSDHLVDLSTNTKMDIQLTEATPMLPEVIVKGTKPRIIDEIQVGKINLKPREVARLPALMGELDVIKSLQTIPGIMLQADGSTFFSVRGGHKDQNLILIDEAPIYNTSHLLGFFSTIIPDAIRDLSIYKSDIPISHGGRLSSLIDIKTNDGNNRNMQVWGSVGLVASKLAVEGPIKKSE